MKNIETASRTRDRRSAFTLVEMLVTITVTLLVMLALVTTFEWIGGRVAEGRSTIELSNELRGAALLLQHDLDRLTVPVRPFTQVEGANGYFHYLELPEWDGTTQSTLSIQGDTDDVLAFTARMDVEQYSGKLPFGVGGSTRATSKEAEIIWWAQHVDLNEDGTITPDEQVNRVLHRRVLLLKPEFNSTTGQGEWFQLPQAFTGAASYNVTNQGDLATLASHLRQLYNTCDVSIRFQRSLAGSNLTLYVYANSLADLTKPENRFMRHPLVLRSGSYFFPAASVSYPNYPFPIDIDPNSVTNLSTIPLWGARRGEDVVLSNVLAFDVHAYDPEVFVADGGGVGLLPSDNGWTPAGAVAGTVARGGFVDLNYRRRFPGMLWTTSAQSKFSEYPLLKPAHVPLTAPFPASPGIQPFYDTWTFHYEENGIDDNGDSVIDGAMNGIDDNGSNGADDPAERDSAPPYDAPLRGISTLLRVYEPDNRQVQQQTVKINFVPE
jgi:type II secretory pathway pseudopilin PulG